MPGSPLAEYADCSRSTSASLRADAERDGVPLDDRRERAAARRGRDGVVRRRLDRQALLALEAPPGERELGGVVVAERPRGRDDQLGEDHDERADDPDPGRTPLGHSSARHPPVVPLYVPPKSASGVRRRIVRSTRGERCSTYQTSSSIRSAHGSVARPWICAQPVRPGRTSRRRRWRSV